jgi:hypothetical protein
MFSTLLSWSMVISSSLAVWLCFVSVLKLALNALEKVSTPFVVLELLSHFVICCCVVVLFLFIFSVEFGDVVVSAVVVDVETWMFGAGGLRVASLNAPSPMVGLSLLVVACLRSSSTEVCHLSVCPCEFARTFIFGT